MVIDVRGLRVSVAMPFYGSMPVESAVSLQRLTNRLVVSGVTHAMVTASSSMGPGIARNILCAQLLANHTDDDAWLFVDSDMTFPDPGSVVAMVTRVVPRLMDAAGVVPRRVVAAAGRIKKDPMVPEFAADIVCDRNGDGTATFPMVEGLLPVRHVGACCLAVQPSVIVEMSQRAEWYEHPGFGRVPNIFYTSLEPGPTGLQLLGEDVSFFRALGAMGEQGYIDPGVRLGHIGTHNYEGAVADHLTA